MEDGDMVLALGVVWHGPVIPWRTGILVRSRDSLSFLANYFAFLTRKN
jgi:hypothetical protein